MEKLRTLQSLIEDLAAHGDRPAVLALHKEGTERWSYAELADRVRRLAVGLIQEGGVGRGDPVALLAGNRPEWLAACLAVIQAGAVVVPLDVQFGDDALAHVLSDSGARLLFTTADQASRLERLDIKAGLTPILLDAGSEDERSWRRLLTDRAGDLPPIEKDDPATLFYTSGTTGPPKGVPLSHGNLAFELNALLEAKLVTADDRILLPLPLHHIYPFVIGMLAPLMFGLPIILPHSLTGPQMVRALKEGEATMILGVPRLYRALHAAIEARSRSGGRVAGALFKASAGLSTWLRRRLGLRVGKVLLRPVHRQFGPQLRVLVSGGAALNPELAWKLEGLGWSVGSGYGLTETAPILTLDPPGRGRIGSVGQPLPGVEIRIDTSAQPAAPQQAEGKQGRYEEGEILARGPNVFAGYHDLPDKTVEAFTDDGWFRTGDLGYFNDDGYLYVTGRVSTLIKTEGGEKIQTEDLEEAYLESPLIGEIGVLRKDNRLVAVVVPEPSEVRRHGGEADQAVRDALGERSRGLPSYQHLSDYAITLEPLPRTHLGKIQRHRLEERYDRAKKGKERPDRAAAGPMAPEEMSGEDRALLDDPAAKQVWDWLAGRYPEARLTPDTSPQLELGIDSLEWMNLTMEIGQRTGIELSEEAIGRIETVRDLLYEVAEQGRAGQGASQASPLERPEEALSDQQKRWLEPLGPMQSALAWCLFALNRALMRGLFHLRVEGLEHLPEQGPFLLAPNHASHLDPLAVAAALDPRRLRQTYWGGWTRTAFGNPLMRLVSRLAHVVPIEPERAARSSLALGAAVLKRRKNLVWFPEGERSPTGDLQLFKPGIGMLLEHFKTPVVPVFLRGTYAAMPRGKILPRLQPVTVIFGQPLDADDLDQQGEGEQAHERIVQALHDRVAALGQPQFVEVGR
jgi:long-chain acyl-CoA synthetase